MSSRNGTDRDGVRGEVVLDPVAFVSVVLHVLPKFEDGMGSMSTGVLLLLKLLTRAGSILQINYSRPVGTQREDFEYAVVGLLRVHSSGSRLGLLGLPLDLRHQHLHRVPFPLGLQQLSSFVTSLFKPTHHLGTDSLHHGDQRLLSGIPDPRVQGFGNVGG